MKKIRIWEWRILRIERTREGYATWGNSDLDLSCKPIFAWSQDLCFYYYFSHSFQGPLSSLSCETGRAQSCTKPQLSFCYFHFQWFLLLGLFPITVLFLPHGSAGLPACSLLRSLVGGVGTCSKMAAVPCLGDTQGWQACVLGSCCPLWWFATLHLNRPIIRFLSMCSRRAAL